MAGLDPAIQGHKWRALSLELLDGCLKGSHGVRIELRDAVR
jgi:hypothetical protein